VIVFVRVRYRTAGFFLVALFFFAMALPFLCVAFFFGLAFFFPFTGLTPIMNGILNPF
jgi:hypothetical protein